MDSLPPLPAEMIGTSDFLDVSVLRLVSRQARDTYTPCAARITVVPTAESDHFLSNITAPFNSRTIVRLTDATQCMSILAKVPHLWCNVKRVICNESSDRHSSWLPFFNTLFPNVESLEIRFEDDDMSTFVVGTAFAKFRQDLTITSYCTSIETNLNVRNLSLRGERLRFDPAVHIVTDSATFVGTCIDHFPASLTVNQKLHLGHCFTSFPSDETVMGPAFRTATDVTLIAGYGLRMAHLCRAGMAAKTLFLKLDSSQQVDMSQLSQFFAEGPLLVERLTLIGAPMNVLSNLYGLSCLRVLDLTPSISPALTAPPAGLAHLMVRVTSSFFGRDIMFMMNYVCALRIMCQSQRVLRLSIYLYGADSQSLIRGEPTMTLHDGAP